MKFVRLLLLILVCSTARGEEFTAPHVMASVRIANGGVRCSGAIISKGKNWGAGTSAAHCFEGKIGNSFFINHPDGRTSEAILLAIDKQSDLALWKIPAKDIRYHSWVPEKWKDAESQGLYYYEAVGYTSGEGPEYKSVKPDSNSGGLFHVETGDFGPGDSGGNVFCNGALVSVISASETPQSPRNNHEIYGCTLEKLVAFLEKNDACFGDDDDECGNWGCRRRKQKNLPPQPPPWKPNPNIPINPPPVDPGTAPPPPGEPPAPVLPAQPDPKIQQLEKIIEEMKKQIDELQKRQPLAGPAGKDGAPGPAGTPGKDGAPGKDAVVDMAAIKLQAEATARAAVDALVASGALKGPKGDKGEDGKQGAKGDKGEPGQTVAHPENRVIYFTSRNIASRTAKTDAIARNMKNSGYPLTIVTLDPKQIDENNVRDVPRVFLLPEERSIVGASDVEAFLNSRSP